MTGRDVAILAGLVGVGGGGWLIHPGAGVMAFALLLFLLGVFYRRKR